MIYTLGHRDSYEQGFEEFKDNPQDFKKLGKHDDYPGGSVWQTYGEAAALLKLNPGFAVYGVLADWNQDTEPDLGGQFHNLLIDAQLVRI